MSLFTTSRTALGPVEPQIHYVLETLLPGFQGIMNQGVTKMIHYRLYGWGLIPGNSKNFVQTSSGVYPASYPMGTREGEGLKVPVSFHLVPRSIKMCEAVSSSTHSYVFMT